MDMYDESQDAAKTQRVTMKHNDFAGLKPSSEMIYVIERDSDRTNSIILILNM